MSAHGHGDGSGDGDDDDAVGDDGGGSGEGNAGDGRDDDDGDANDGKVVVMMMMVTMMTMPYLQFSGHAITADTLGISCIHRAMFAPIAIAWQLHPHNLAHLYVKRHYCFLLLDLSGRVLMKTHSHTC